MTLWYIGTIGLLILIFASILYLSLKKTLERSIDISLHTVGEEIEHALLKNPYERWEEIFNKEREELPISLMYIQIMKISEKGKGPNVIVKSKTLEGDALSLSQNAYTEAMRGRTSFEIVTVKDISEYPLRVITLPVKEKTITAYIVQIGTPLKEMVNTSRKLLIILLITGPILLILSSFGGYFLVRKAFSPVKKIVEAAKKITAEDLSHRIEPIGSKDEISELAETFNDMISRLERSFKQIKQFSSDASHELKTPLTAIRGEIEVALRKGRGREEYKKILKSALEEIDKLQKIIDNLLLLAQMDSQNIKLSFKEIQLDEILLEAFEEIETLAKREKLSLILKRVDQVGLKGDETLIKRLFVNLVDNAIKYTQEGGKVEISLEKENKSAKFTVKDIGIGIPEDALPYIFDRFYRVDKARSRETGGCGLGLAIAKWIVETHKGKIEVRSKVGKGSLFAISFPLQD